MYIVIPNAFSTSMMNNNFVVPYNPQAPIFFQTKEELMKYLRAYHTGQRIFEAKELSCSVEVNLSEKPEVTLSPFNVG